LQIAKLKLTGNGFTDFPNRVSGLSQGEIGSAQMMYAVHVIEAVEEFEA